MAEEQNPTCGLKEFVFSGMSVDEMVDRINEANRVLHQLTPRLADAKGEEREKIVAALDEALRLRVTYELAELRNYPFSEDIGSVDPSKVADSPAHVEEILRMLSEERLRTAALLYLLTNALVCSRNDLRRLFEALKPLAGDQTAKVVMSFIGVVMQANELNRHVRRAIFAEEIELYEEGGISIPSVDYSSLLAEHFQDPAMGSLEAFQVAMGFFKWFFARKPDMLMSMLDYFEAAGEPSVVNILHDVCRLYFQDLPRRAAESAGGYWGESLAREAQADYWIGFAARALKRGEDAEARRWRVEAVECYWGAYEAVRQFEPIQSDTGQWPEDWEYENRLYELLSQTLGALEPLLMCKLELPEDPTRNDTLLYGLHLLLADERDRGGQLVSGHVEGEAWLAAREIQARNPSIVPLLYERLGDNPEALVFFFATLFLRNPMSGARQDVESTPVSYHPSQFAYISEYFANEGEEGPLEDVARLAVQGMDDRQRSLLADTLGQDPAQAFSLGSPAYTRGDLELLNSWYKTALAFLRQASQEMKPRTVRGLPPRPKPVSKKEIRKLVTSFFDARTPSDQAAVLDRLRQHVPHAFPRNLLAQLQELAGTMQLFDLTQRMFGPQLARSGQESLVPNAQTEIFHQKREQFEKLLDEWTKKS